MKKKQKDDVMGEEESDLPVVDGELHTVGTIARNVLIDHTVVPGGCPGCQLKKAFFFQLQTRSADEPPTSFYKVSFHIPLWLSSDGLISVLVRCMLEAMARVLKYHFGLYAVPPQARSAIWV